MRATGLRRRTLFAGGVLAAAVAVVIGLLLANVEDLRTSQRDALKSGRVLAQAAMNEKLLIDMETGVRGFVITGRQDFLAPWRAARAALPAAARRLESLAAGDPSQQRRARASDSAIAAYARNYTAPLIARARRSLAAARSVVETAEGKARVDAIRSQFATLDAIETRHADARSGHADAVASRAIAIAVAGLVGLFALVFFMTRYVRRALAREHAAAPQATVAQARLAVLARASEILTESLDYERTLERVAQVLVPVIGDWCSVELVSADGTLRNVVVA